MRATGWAWRARVAVLAGVIVVWCGACSKLDQCLESDDCDACGTCQNGACVPMTCAEGEACVAGACRALCYATENCAASDACIDGYCQPYAQACQVHSDCVEGWFCTDQHSCRRKLANGEACVTDGASCASSFCVEEICCESECTDSCYTCVGASMSAEGVSGKCGPVSAGSDPYDDCSGAKICDGGGGCVAAPVGTACTGDEQCATFHCVDGYCCDSGCAGTCARCDDPSRLGECTAVVNVTDDTCDADTAVGACAAPPCICTDTATCDEDCPSGFFRCSLGCCQVEAMAAGIGHTCALVNSQVMCWGANQHKQLGGACTTTACLAPVVVPGLSNVVSLTAGSNHTCALTSTAVMCWGDNFAGQVGANCATSTCATPVAASAPNVPAVGSILALVAASDRTCATTSTGVSCWGSGATAGMTAADTTADLAVGALHTCVVVGIRGGTTLQCWGQNNYGQLGVNCTQNSCATPVAIPSMGTIAAIVAGSNHTCAVESVQSRIVEFDNWPTSSIVCWGYNGSGQLGDRCATTSCSTPLVVASNSEFFGVNALSPIAAGANHTCAAISDVVNCWGDNSFGQLGPACTTATCVMRVEALDKGSVRLLASGSGHTCALTPDGVWCWGSNGLSQLGANCLAGSCPEAVPVSF